MTNETTAGVEQRPYLVGCITLTDPDYIAELAARLTQTQWDALGHLEHIGKPWRFPVRWSVLVGYSLERLSLARRTFWLDKTYLTPLGKVALRARQPQQAKD